MLHVTLTKVHDPEEYELMEWLQAHPGDWDKVPERLRPWKSTLRSKGFVNFEDMITGHTLSDLGRIALLKYQRKRHAEAQQTVEVKAAASEHRQPACDGDGEKKRIDAAVQKIREALKRKPELKTGKCGIVIKEAQVRKKHGLAALRQLRKTGEYTGGGRDRDD
jgi:hypothetical protein